MYQRDTTSVVGRWSLVVAGLTVLAACGPAGSTSQPPHKGVSQAESKLSASSTPIDQGVKGPPTQAAFDLTVAKLNQLSPKPQNIPPPLDPASRSGTVLPLTPITAPAVTGWEAYGTNPSTGAPYGGLSIGGEAADAQISVSTTHVIVTARDALAFYTKSGLKVFGVVDGLSFFTAAGVTNKVVLNIMWVG